MDIFNIKDKIKELENINNQILKYAEKNNLHDLFWNSTYVDEHIRDLKESRVV